MKRLAIFASYSANGRVADYVFFYLRALRRFADIIFVADCELAAGELARLAPLVLHAQAARHGEYDFGSYKRGFFYAKERGLLEGYDELILCNDSVFGPFWGFGEMELAGNFGAENGAKNAEKIAQNGAENLAQTPQTATPPAQNSSNLNLNADKIAAQNVPNSNLAQNSAAQTTAHNPAQSPAPADIRAALQSQNIFDFMRQRCEREGSQAWGLMRHAATPRFPAHLQSYFVVLGRGVFAGAGFARFLGGVAHHEDKMEIVWRYEIGLSEFLRKSGVKTSALLASRNVGDPRRELIENAADTQHLLALQRGFGFLKIGSFLDNPGGDITLESVREIRRIVCESGYDWGMIERHLRERGAAKLRGGGAANSNLGANDTNGAKLRGGAAGATDTTDANRSGVGANAQNTSAKSSEGELPRIYPRKSREFCVGGDILRFKRRPNGRIVIDLLGRKIFSSTPLTNIARALRRRLFGTLPQPGRSDYLTLPELLDEIKRD